MAEVAGHNVLDYEWPCPSCTFINKPGSFKCHMCKTPKGTATRQVKSSVSALEMQYATETAIKAHNSRLKAAAAAAAANQIVGGLSPSAATITTTSPSPSTSSLTVSNSTNCTNLPGHSYSSGNLGVTGQKRKQRSRAIRNSSISLPSKRTKITKSTAMSRRVKRSCNITVDGVTVTITELDTTLCSDSD